jgi:hypothetical protein
MSRITGNDAKGLMEAYGAVYTPQELTEEQVWEEVETWVNSLLEEGYDLSDYTWEEMYESYLEEAPMTAFQAAGGNAKLAQLNKGRSPRAGRVTPAQLERQGQQNLYKAGGGDAAIAKGPTRTQNVRGGSTRQVPTLTRQDIINRGTVAGAPPAARTPAATPAARTPATPGVTTVPIRPRTPAAAPAPAARTPGATPAPATTKVAPAPAPTAGKVAPTPAGGSALDRATAAASKPAAFSPKPQSDVGKMIDASKARQAAQTPKPATPAPAARPMGSARERMLQRQSFDVFDVIKGHLIDEGYADTEEAALVIMANMSESWKNSIIG